MMTEKLKSCSSPEALGDGSLPRQGLKPTRTLSSEFRSVKCPKLEQAKWGFSGSVVCQNETAVHDKIDAHEKTRLLRNLNNKTPFWENIFLKR